MLGLSVIAAETDAEAARLATSQQQAFARLRSGRPGKLPPPVDDIDAVITPMERANVDHALSCAVIGGPQAVRRGLQAFAARTGADELMATAQIFDHAARLRSLEITAEAVGQVAMQVAA